jgi:hypothetical protein
MGFILTGLEEVQKHFARDADVDKLRVTHFAKSVVPAALPITPNESVSIDKQKELDDYSARNATWRRSTYNPLDAAERFEKVDGKAYKYGRPSSLASSHSL